MKVLKFRVHGQSACFRKPDTNKHCIFTYQHIHKPCLLGMLGGFLGLAGYTLGDNQLPQYYSELNHLKVAIVPSTHTTYYGLFSTKVQQYVNATGFNHGGLPCLLTEQVLENVDWTIYVLCDDSSVCHALVDCMLRDYEVHMPYFGNTKHTATLDIFSKEVIEVTPETNPSCIDSLIPSAMIHILDADDLSLMAGTLVVEEEYFTYSEYLPVSLDNQGFYQHVKMTYTNNPVKAHTPLMNCFKTSEGLTLYFV